MNIKAILGATVLAPALFFGSAAHAASVDPVYDEFVVINGETSFFVDTFMAEYSLPHAVTLTDLGLPSAFSALELYILSTQPDTKELELIGPGTGTFDAMMGETYTVTLFGIPGLSGTGIEASVAGVEISAVPVPPAVWLFGSAVVGLAALGRSRAARKAAAAA
jgi:hypothetical protein